MLFSVNTLSSNFNEELNPVSKAHRTLYDPTTIRLDLGQIAKHAGSRSVTFPSRRPSRIASREDLTVESLRLSRELGDKKYGGQ